MFSVNLFKPQLPSKSFFKKILWGFYYFLPTKKNPEQNLTPVKEKVRQENDILCIQDSN